MAIKNASDLLVYKSGAATAQVTKITVASTPLSGDGHIFIDNVVNGSDVESDDVRVPISGTMANTKAAVAANIKTRLEAFGYTCSSVTDGVFTATNGATGFVPTIALKDGDVTIDDGAIQVEVETTGSDAGYEPIAFSTSANVTFTADLRDVTTKDSGGFAEYVKGIQSFEMTTDALQDYSANLDFQNFWEDLENRTKITLRFSERLTGGADKYYQGDAFVTSLSVDAGVEDNVTYSVTFTGTAATTEGSH